MNHSTPLTTGAHVAAVDDLRVLDALQYSALSTLELTAAIRRGATAADAPFWVPEVRVCAAVARLASDARVAMRPTSVHPYSGPEIVRPDPGEVDEWEHGFALEWMRGRPSWCVRRPIAMTSRGAELYEALASPDWDTMVEIDSVFPATDADRRSESLVAGSRSVGERVLRLRLKAWPPVDGRSIRTHTERECWVRYWKRLEHAWIAEYDLATPGTDSVPGPRREDWRAIDAWRGWWSP